MANMKITTAPTVSVVSENDYVMMSVGDSLRRVGVKNLMQSVEGDDAMKEAIYAYGVEIDESLSTSACTRVGNMSLHASLPVQNMMRGCLLDDDGNVVKYLNDDTWEDEPTDGSQGQVMVELPEHYTKFTVTTGGKLRAMISLYPLKGYTKVEKMYVSAYEASIQRSTGKLCSVRNKTADYRGGNNQSAWDSDDSKTQLGRPVTNISRTAFRAAARKRSATSEWNCLTERAWRTVFWMYVIEYADRNIQLPYNAQLTSQGFKQGGLGPGVTQVSSSLWSTMTAYHPFIPCGASDRLGNGSGYVNYTIPHFGSPTDAAYTAQVSRYRGIENWYGHTFCHMDGLNAVIASADNADPTSKLYLCNNPRYFADDTTEHYRYVGNLPRAEGYIRNIMFGSEGLMAAKGVGASATTGYVDYFYTSLPTSGVAHRVLLVSGYADIGSSCGLACANANTSASSAGAHLGSRLCFIRE